MNHENTSFPSHFPVFIHLAFYDVTVFSSVDGVGYSDSFIICAENSLEAISRALSSPVYVGATIEGTLAVLNGNPLVDLVD